MSRHVHIPSLPWEEQRSPGGKFHSFYRNVSIALGGLRNGAIALGALRHTPTGLGGHPFDLELSRLAPGECGCPFHRHAAEWELFLILRGSATVQTDSAVQTLHPGDVVLHPPGEAHQITNGSETEMLEFLLIANNAPVEYWFYPDSNKWGIRAPRTFFRATEADYWDGEE